MQQAFVFLIQITILIDVHFVGICLFRFPFYVLKKVMLCTEIVINMKRENDQNDKTDLQDRLFSRLLISFRDATYHNCTVASQFPPPKFRGVFNFKLWTKRVVMKKLHRNRRVSWRGGFPNCFISFSSEKHVFITIGIFFFFFLSGKYSCLL